VKKKKTMKMIGQKKDQILHLPINVSSMLLYLVPKLLGHVYLLYLGLPSHHHVFHTIEQVMYIDDSWAKDSYCLLVVSSSKSSSQPLDIIVARCGIWFSWVHNHLATFSCFRDSNCEGIILGACLFCWCMSTTKIASIKEKSC
jgi:hypothetical protein